MTALFANGSRRILALWFPYLPTDRVRRRRLGRAWRSAPARSVSPLVFSRMEDNRRRIAALDEQAEALGLKHGMGIADAQAMYPRLEVMEEEPEQDRRLLESLADWCDRYTPLVAVDGTDGLFLDVTGCTHLFGGEAAVLSEIRQRLLQLGLLARAALSSTPAASWAAARFLSDTIISGGDERQTLSPLPLQALRLERGTRERLEQVGLRTVGRLLAMPRGPLARRFGRQLMLRLDQALGEAEEAISPRLPVPPLSVERQLAEPLLVVEQIEALLAELAIRLKEDLERRGEGARSLELALFRVDGEVARIRVGSSRPLRDPRLVGRLFHEKLAALNSDIDAGCGFEAVRLSVLAAASFADRQTDLVEDDNGEESLALFADRVRARLGDHAVLGPVARESHIPERAVTLKPFFELPRQPAGRPCHGSARERPVRLFERPEPVEPSSFEAPPRIFRWRQVVHTVLRSEGPERLAPEWWIEEESAASRDYFRVEDAAGHRYWMFRERTPGQEAEPRWFLHGIFA